MRASLVFLQSEYFPTDLDADFGVHAKHVGGCSSNRRQRNDLPVRVKSEIADSYPRIRGFRPEQGGEVEGLEGSDFLIRAGDADLRGVGHIAFDAIAIEQAGRDRHLFVEIERDGQRRLVSFELPRHVESCLSMRYERVTRDILDRITEFAQVDRKKLQAHQGGSFFFGSVRRN